MKIVIGLLAAAFVALGQSDNRVRPTTDTRGAVELGRLPTDERIHAYEAILAKLPDDRQAQAGLTSAYLQKLRESADYHYLDLAAKLVDRMMEDSGGSLAALRFQDEIDLQRHDFRAVAERAADVTKYELSDPGVWGNLGDALMELGDYERAGNAYLKMFSLRPNLGSYNRLAWFRFVTGDADSGIALMKQAISAGDSQPETVAWCYAELGDMQFKTGQVDEAMESYSSALALYPKLHRALAGLGRVQATKGDMGSAIKSYIRAQEIVPLVEYSNALANSYTRAGQMANADKQLALIEALEKVGSATNEKTNRNLALALADHRMHLDAALTLVQTELATRPDVYTYDALGWALLKNGHVSEASNAVKIALRLNTPEPMFYVHAREIALAAGDAAAAQTYDERVKALNPKTDVAQISLRGK